MRVSRSEMELSHQRIVEGAARLIRERGIETTSVSDVMGEAGFKHGGFYRHFETKEAMVDEALQSAFGQIISALEARFAEEEPETAATGFRAHYLSKGHVEHPGLGCPVAALGPEVARAPDQLKASFSAGVNQMITTLAKGMRGRKQEQRTSAAREFAMLVGAVIIARATDQQTASSLLSACRKSSKGA